MILLNTVWMATEHEPSQADYEFIQSIGDYIFIIIYVAETAAKLFAYGVISWYYVDGDSVAEGEDDGGLPAARQNGCLPKMPKFFSPYFGDPWNAFDFVVVALSLVDIFVSIDLAVFKLLRVLRVFRLVRRIKTLQVFVCFIACLFVVCARARC